MDIIGRGSIPIAFHLGTGFPSVPDVVYDILYDLRAGKGKSRVSRPGVIRGKISIVIVIGFRILLLGKGNFLWGRQVIRVGRSDQTQV